MKTESPLTAATNPMLATKISHVGIVLLIVVSYTDAVSLVRNIPSHPVNTVTGLQLLAIDLIILKVWYFSCKVNILTYKVCNKHDQLVLNYHSLFNTSRGVGIGIKKTANVIEIVSVGETEMRDKLGLVACRRAEMFLSRVMGE